MVSTVKEVEKSVVLLEEARADLNRQNVTFGEPAAFGIMIEVPSAIDLIPDINPYVDFYSIGTNDLIQYLMAADRTNQSVGELTNPLHPVLLRSIRQIIKTAHKGGKSVTICGEISAMKPAIPFLVGMDVDNLSLNAHMIPQIKKTVSSLSYKEAKELADKALKLDRASHVEQLVENTTWW